MGIDDMRGPRKETLEKLALLIELLKHGYSLREAKLEWKSWYEYGEPLVAHLRVPRPPEVKTYVRVGPVKIFRSIDIF